ncbi:MAG: hypothetical protein ACRDTA_14960 [Pseudonocardiaceae bacterium]
MTTSQETMTDAARRGQEAITSALQIWAESVQRFVPMSDTKLRGAVEAVDNMFDFYEQMLVTQREFTKSVMAATTSATTKAAYVAQDAAKDMEYAAKDMTKDMVPNRDVAPNKEAASRKS